MQATEWRDAPEAEFAVIGDPVEHSLSPRMQAAAFQELGLPFRYVALRVVAGEVGPALERLATQGYRGVNVTVPHKEEAYAWVGDADAFSKRARAVNTVNLNDRSGTNTDGLGFLDTLKPFSLRPRSRMLIFGAGGSTRSISVALEDAGFAVSIHNRTFARAVALARELGLAASVLDDPDPSGATVIINATSAGLQGLAPMVRWEKAPRDAIAYDLFYSSSGTPFLIEAARAGLRCVDGSGLLVAQGARSLEWWLGISAPREAMLKALR